MGETLDFWLSGRTWTDWQQGKRMDEIESAQAAQAASLSRTVRNQTTALDARVSRLEDALAAFVELEDTRSTLNEFADAAAARRFARDLAQQLLGADAPSAPPAPPNDLPGYWLTPAVKAVIADVFPGTGDAAALTAEARRRDDESADLFALLVDALRGRAADAGDRVDRWMPTGEAIDRTQRAVCDAVASGRFGELSQPGSSIACGRWSRRPMPPATSGPRTWLRRSASAPSQDHPTRPPTSSMIFAGSSPPRPARPTPAPTPRSPSATTRWPNCSRW